MRSGTRRPRCRSGGGWWSRRRERGARRPCARWLQPSASSGAFAWVLAPDVTWGRRCSYGGATPPRRRGKTCSSPRIQRSSSPRARWPSRGAGARPLFSRRRNPPTSSRACSAPRPATDSGSASCACTGSPPQIPTRGTREEKPSARPRSCWPEPYSRPSTPRAKQPRAELRRPWLPGSRPRVGRRRHTGYAREPHVFSRWTPRISIRPGTSRRSTFDPSPTFRACPRRWTIRRSGSGGSHESGSFTGPERVPSAPHPAYRSGRGCWRASRRRSA